MDVLAVALVLGALAYLLAHRRAVMAGRHLLDTGLLAVLATCVWDSITDQVWPSIIGASAYWVLVALTAIEASREIERGQLDPEPVADPGSAR